MPKKGEENKEYLFSSRIIQKRVTKHTRMKSHRAAVKEDHDQKVRDARVL